MPQTTDELINTLQEWVALFMHRSMEHVLLFIKENNLSMSQMGALMNIHRQGVCTVSDIGDELGITSAAASQMLERLVQQELVERTEDPNDRRVKQIALTDKATRIIQENFRLQHTWLGELAGSFTPAEQEQVQAALHLMLEKMKQLDEIEGE
ncbi:MAG: MarR family transcriptional regulator [Anaerolineae bacterium]